MKVREQRPFRSSQSGFTLIELLVVMALAMILMLIASGPVMQMLSRQRLEGTARQISALVQRARLEAIKRQVNTVVRIDVDSNQVIAFADIHDSFGNISSDQLFDPVVGARPQTTDYQFGVVNLPAGVTFTAPDGQLAVEGFGTPPPVPVPVPPALLYSPDGDDDDDSTPVFNPALSPVMVFEATGSVSTTGAVRLADARENFLEVRVGPRATGRVQMRKWNDGAEEWRLQGGAGEAWQWN